MDCKVWIEDHRGWIALLHIEDEPKPKGKYCKISNIRRTESPNFCIDIATERTLWPILPTDTICLVEP